jgi:hypothetical protein
MQEPAAGTITAPSGNEGARPSASGNIVDDIKKFEQVSATLQSTNIFSNAPRQDLQHMKNKSRTNLKNLLQFQEGLRTEYHWEIHMALAKAHKALNIALGT